MKDTNPVFMKLMESIERVDKEVELLSREKCAVLLDLVKAYYEDESTVSDLADILENDDYLTELLVDKTAYLNIVESELGDDPLKALEADDPSFSKYEVEEAYVSLTDTLFELSKSINPLSGFGKDRLMAGLSIIRSFEERFWPLATKITFHNAIVFKDLIPPEHYDDILAGRKHAIGALRMVGDRSCAAGVIVYTIPFADDDTPMIRLDWIMVHEDMRQKGIGNFLIAQVLELTFQYDGMGIYADLPVKIFEDDQEAATLSLLYNCLDSWDLLFDLTLGNSFVLKISDCRGNNAIDREPKNVISVGNMGYKASEMIDRFFADAGNYFDEGLPALPVEFFDKDLSCAALHEGRIRAMLLIHRLEDDSLRYEGLIRTEDSEPEDILNLLRSAYGACREKGLKDSMLFGYLWSIEGMELLGSIIPEAQVTMLYRGILLPEEVDLSSEDWSRLRNSAGLSDDKIPDEGITDEEIGQEETALIKSCLEDSIY